MALQHDRICTTCTWISETQRSLLSNDYKLMKKVSLVWYSVKRSQWRLHTCSSSSKFCSSYLFLSIFTLSLVNQLHAMTLGLVNKHKSGIHLIQIWQKNPKKIKQIACLHVLIKQAKRYMLPLWSGGLCTFKSLWPSGVMNQLVIEFLCAPGKGRHYPDNSQHDERKLSSLELLLWNYLVEVK